MLKQICINKIHINCKLQYLYSILMAINTKHMSQYLPEVSKVIGEGVSIVVEHWPQDQVEGPQAVHPGRHQLHQ